MSDNMMNSENATPTLPMAVAEAIPDTEFDREGVFGEGYLASMAERLDARAGAEVDLIWRLLDLEPGMEVLDLACGHGRHANRLAQRGCAVTGLDATLLYLDRARADAAELGVAVEYQQGDIRELSWNSRFDRAMNWFNSFGYFSDEECRGILRRIATALRPDGRFVIELSNYSWLLANFKESEVRRSSDSEFTAHRRLDLLASRTVTTQTITEKGRTRDVPYFIRQFTFTELRDWLLEAGFTRVDGYGEDGSPLSVHHRHMIAIATR
jgi:SAM-dependent methyltransferase